MIIATWNINSVRLRLPLLRQLIQQHRPDVICLQETKVVDELFPVDELQKEGYAHQFFSGMKSYNGVAILSREKLSDTGVHHWCGQRDCRHIAATLRNGLRLHNIYVPAGGYEPDVKKNPKFLHKLNFVEEQEKFWAKQKNKKSMIVGDLNIAPLEHDVWSHAQMKNVVSHTADEILRFTAWQKSAGMVDVMRALIPPAEKLYTWWSYRAPDWEKANRGRRLDHVWMSDDSAGMATRVHVLRDYRAAAQPSDHVPVLLEIE
ncbi:MAG: exodeoxyribonuclease III [Alphaproteobacteria bacterium]|nr:exodeoxyribonuclease III [Alphaproteobacteria bacterium]NDG04428.1 exodeoxyribonuclease III [Alphaproteobacteria bacterium]